MTREELAEALEESARESEYALNEWYEKFNTLHLRLSKRVKREEAKVPRSPAQMQLEVNEERPTALRHRRLGSV